jgi:hypothetical protein
MQPLHQHSLLNVQLTIHSKFVPSKLSSVKIPIELAKDPDIIIPYIHKKLHFLTFYLIYFSALYLLTNDERALPGNLQSRARLLPAPLY